MPNQQSDLQPGVQSKAPLSAEQQLELSSKRFAASLRAYAKEAKLACKLSSDEQLIAARKKIELARKLVKDSGIAGAVCGTIVNHVQFWPSWISQNDFQSSVGFQATEICANEIEKSDEETISTIELTFNEKRYRITLRDFGSRGDYHPGQVELFLNNERVAKFDMQCVCSEHFYGGSHWEFRDVLSLRSGAWMKDVVDIAAQIEAPNLKFVEDFFNGHTRQPEIDRLVADEIDLSQV